MYATFYAWEYEIHENMFQNDIHKKTKDKNEKKN